MNSFFLNFKDPNLESKYQADLKFAKFLRFHVLLIFEFLMIIIISLVNIIIRGASNLNIINLSFLIFFFFVIIFTTIKLKNWEYLVYFQITIHILLLIIIIETTKQLNRKEEIGKVFEVISIMIHLLFMSIILTRINWIVSGFLYLLFTIYYVLRRFSIERVQDQPFIVLVHFGCLICFLFFVIFQEKTIRIFYQCIHESNLISLQYELLLKKIIPSPIFIVDFENQNMKFFNDSASEFVKKIEQNQIDLMQSSPKNLYLSEEKKKFLEIDSYSRFINILGNFKFSNELEKDNSIKTCLLEYFNDKNLELKNQIYIQNNNFQTLNLYLEDDLFHDSPLVDKIMTKKYYELKYIKMLWQNSKTLLIILNDITELHKLEELKHLDDYKNKLLATVSHDLRTPLNGMIGMMELIKPKLKEKKDIKNLVIAIRSGHLLTNMINDILDFSQINNKKLRLSFQCIDLVETLKETSKLLKFGIKSKGLKLFTNFKKNINAKIISDCTRINQIVLNLMSNALKFTSSGYIKLSLDEEIINFKKFFKISVEDTGIGIRQEDQSKLFKLFGKLEQTDLNINKNGIGLGLTISKNLVKLLNETDSEGIYLQSQLGVGSKFWFYLKQQDNKSINDDFSFEIPNENKQSISFDNMSTNYLLMDSTTKLKKKILIVDDDMVNQMVAKMYCEYFGVDYETSNDGSEAVNLIKSYLYKEIDLFDCIFMDMNMPIMDGITASNEIFKLLKGKQKKQIPIIMMSAGISWENKISEKENYIKEIVQKPISKTKFADIMGKIIDH